MLWVELRHMTYCTLKDHLGLFLMSNDWIDNSCVEENASIRSEIIGRTLVFIIQTGSPVVLEMTTVWAKYCPTICIIYPSTFKGVVAKLKKPEDS